MLKTLAASSAAALVGLATTAVPAHAHDVRGYLSSAGLDFVAQQVPSLVPSSLDAPPLSKSLACITATQRNTHVNLQVNDFQLTIPQEGRLRLYIDLGVEGTGELYVDNAVACFGSLTCQDALRVNDARATIDFDVDLSDGTPHVSVANVDLQLSRDDIDVTFSGCAVSSVANSVINFAKQYVLDYLLDKAEQMAQDTMGPMIESMLAGVGDFGGSFHMVDFTAALRDLHVALDGIEIGAEVDLSSQAPAAQCVADYDKGAPAPIEGTPPDLSQSGAEVNLAVNTGLLNAALYQVWRQGTACIDGDSLAALGVELDINQFAQMLPGFPAGSTFGMEMHMTQPPEMRSSAPDGSDGADDDLGATVTAVMHGIQVTLTGHEPDGTSKSIDVSADIEATLAVGVDPDSNALVATPVGVKIVHLDADQVYAAQVGLDVSRLTTVLQDYMLPGMLAKLGTMPLTGPVFSTGQYAVILRQLATTDAYLSVGADLFKVPDDDFGSPETSIIAYPTHVVSPADATLRVSAVDNMIPTELLRYRVSIDGEDRDPTYVRRVPVGKLGESGTYHVEVAALDLSGNVDTTPASVDVMVDGIAPTALIDGTAIRKVGDAAKGDDADGTVNGRTATLTWKMSDDLTDATALSARIELFEITDPSDALAVEHLSTQQLSPGATTAQVTVEGNKLYRAELHVTDAVGNDTVASVLLDATVPSGGCSAGGGAGGAAGFAVMLALAGLVLGPRRRRRAQA